MITTTAQTQPIQVRRNIQDSSHRTKEYALSNLSVTSSVIYGEDDDYAIHSVEAGLYSTGKQQGRTVTVSASGFADDGVAPWVAIRLATYETDGPDADSFRSTLKGFLSLEDAEKLLQELTEAVAEAKG